MTNEQQKQLVNEFIERVRVTLLDRADRWPKQWDGHELKELVAEAFANERTRLMQEKYSRRRKNSHTEMVTLDLF